MLLLGNVDAYDQSGSGDSFYTLILRIIGLDFIITPPKVSSEGCNPVHTHPSEASFFLQVQSTNTYRNVNGQVSG
jgi:hypothetical protein